MTWTFFFQSLSLPSAPHFSLIPKLYCSTRDSLHLRYFLFTLVPVCIIYDLFFLVIELFFVQSCEKLVVGYFITCLCVLLCSYSRFFDPWLKRILIHFLLLLPGKKRSLISNCVTTILKFLQVVPATCDSPNREPDVCVFLKSSVVSASRICLLVSPFWSALFHGSVHRNLSWFTLPSPSVYVSAAEYFHINWALVGF